MTEIIASGEVGHCQEGRVLAPPAAPPALFRRRPFDATANRLTKANIPATMAAEVKPLVEATFSADPVERGRAATRLGSLREKAAGATPYLIRLLVDGTPTEFRPDWGMVPPVSVAAVGALVEIGSPAVDACVAAIKNSNGETVRELVGVLTEIKDPRAVQPVTDLLTDFDPQIRLCVARALLHWPDRRFIPPLIDAMKDTNPEVRAAAISDLEENRDAKAVVPLMAAIQDKDKSVRQCAARALGVLRDQRAGPELLSTARNSKEDEHVRWEAARAFGNIPAAGAGRALLAVLTDRSTPDVVRQGAAEGLALAKDRDTVGPVCAFVTEPAEAPNVRGEAIRTVVVLQGAASLPILKRVATTESEDDHVRCCAAVSLVTLANGAIDDIRVVSALQGRYSIENHRTAIVEAAETKKKTVAAVAQNGTTQAVRDAAKTLLSEWERGCQQ